MNEARKLMTARLVATLILVVLGVIGVGALQAALFYDDIRPRLERANAQLFELGVESSQRSLYYEITRRVRALIASAPEIETSEATLGDAWKDFEAHFVVAPGEAVDTLVRELPALTAGNRADAGAVRDLTNRLERLQAIYADSYRDLLADLKEPPAFLWPMASIVADRSGYRQAIALNRSIYLARTGEIGTARVVLAGLNASVEDPDVLATVYYTLARLQFELFRATPEAEYYTQSIQFLRQSLVTDPDFRLAQRLLDFLLSLPQAATAPQAADGRPETPSEGEGAAISPEQRIF